MTDFKKNLTERLKKLGKDREWLAEKIGCSKHTVDNWFAPSKVMTEGNKLVVEQILKKEEDRQADYREIRKHAKSYAVVFSLEEHERIARAAAKLGRKVDEWSEEVLIDEAAKVLGKLDYLNDFEFGSFAAEEGRPYGSDSED